MNWWHYLLLVNIYLLLFYSFYALLLRRETFFQLNRIYLVSASLLSFIIPVIQADWVKNLFITEQVHYRIYGESSVVNIYNFHPVESSPVTIGEVLTLLYLIGIAVLTLRFALQLIRVNKILKTPEPSTAFAFFKRINLDENALDQQAVLAHEQVHAKQWHSLDVLLIETVMIMNWFNPVVYLYRFAIKHIHEYIADQQVIKIGADKAEYAMLLVSQTFNAPSSGLVSAFTGSLLKKRIKMLQKDRSKRIVLFKYMLSAPLFGLMLILSSATIEDNKAINLIRNHASVLFDQSAKSMINDIVSPVDSLIDIHSQISNDDIQDEKIYDAVDVEPEFQGGPDALNRFLAMKIKYPAKARENNTQGRVYVQFVVEPNGEVSNVKATHGPSPELNEEAVRVVKLSPKWKPGEVKDKKVRTSYTIPVNFVIAYDDAQPAPPQKVKDVVLTPPGITAKETTVIAYGNNLSVAPSENKENKVYEAVEKEPEFPGGADAFNQFIANTIKVPAIDKENNVSGKAYVSFVVEPDGSLSSITAVRGPSETTKAEAVRAVGLSPKWYPGIQNGKAVRVSYTVPIAFNMSKNDNAGTNSPTQKMATLTPPPVKITVRDPNAVYESAQKEPEFPGGVEAFNRFLSGEVKYPAVDRDKNVTGRVYVNFIVEKDGSLSNVTAIRGPSETTKAEAARAIALSPKWRPGLQNGTPVRVSYTVPVTFTLTADKDDLANVSTESIQVKWLRANTVYNITGGKILIIVNGKEFTSGMNTLKAEDIKMVTILKDDAAIKKYGEKGKNGVIEIILK